jgi:hypothetical protein
LWKVDPITKAKLYKVDIDTQNIAWMSDIKYKFNNTKMESVPNSYKAKFNEDITKVTYKDIQWKDMLDQHFIIWMRTAGLPTFRKLWGKVFDLEPGVYHLEI